jgi:dienelactone hydrolase
LGGCATQSTFLTEALAEHGYFVVAPNHKDAGCAKGRGRRNATDRSLEPFQNPERWSDTSFADRRDDIRAILDAMKRDTTYANHIDFAQLALAGHSLGGYTVVGLGGGWSSWRMPGVKAVLALSAYTDPFLVHGTLGGISAPVMYEGGTLDLGITPSLKKSKGVYDSSPTPKYYVEFRGAGHFAWTNLRNDFHATILDYSIAFLDHYVRGVGTLEALHTKQAKVADLRFMEK